MQKPTRKPAKARILSSNTLYHGPAFSVSKDIVLEPSGVEARRDIVHHSGSVVILAVDDRNAQPQVLLEYQYRHAAQRYLWELPAGRIDKGEKALAAAKRELLEETGYSAQRWKRILLFWASPGFVAETMSLFHATGLRAGVAQPEEDEAIETRFFSLSAAVNMVMTGKICDGKTISGILWLAQQQRGRTRRR